MVYSKPRRTSLYAGLVHLRFGFLISGAIITRTVAPGDGACQPSAARRAEQLTTTGFLYHDHGVRLTESSICRRCRCFLGPVPDDIVQP
jgi:hypothetical protein